MHTRESNRTQSGRDQPSAPPTTTARRRPNRHRNEPRPPTPSDSSSQLYYTILYYTFLPRLLRVRPKWQHAMANSRTRREKRREKPACRMCPARDAEPTSGSPAVSPSSPAPAPALHCTALHIGACSCWLGWESLEARYWELLVQLVLCATAARNCSSHLHWSLPFARTESSWPFSMECGSPPSMTTISIARQRRCQLLFG